MIVKERPIPIRIQKCEALLRRIMESYPKRAAIESDLTRRWSGYRGEQAVDFPLSKLPEKDYLIFHGVRLTNGKYYFQIDTLILSPYFALILEIKNYKGTLYFDPILNQLIQVNLQGEEKGYSNPVEQAYQQRQELKRWLEQRNIILPITHLVIISKPFTIIKTAPGHERILEKVLHVQYLLRRIENLHSIYQKEHGMSTLN